MHRGKGDNKLGLFLTCCVSGQYQSSLWELAMLWAVGVQHPAEIHICSFWCS